MLEKTFVRDTEHTELTESFRQENYCPPPPPVYTPECSPQSSENCSWVHTERKYSFFLSKIYKKTHKNIYLRIKFFFESSHKMISYLECISLLAHTYMVNSKTRASKSTSRDHVQLHALTSCIRRYIRALHEPSTRYPKPNAK